MGLELWVGGLEIGTDFGYFRSPKMRGNLIPAETAFAWKIFPWYTFDRENTILLYNGVLANVFAFIFGVGFGAGFFEPKS